jgi:hypothetical protein
VSMMSTADDRGYAEAVPGWMRTGQFADSERWSTPHGRLSEPELFSGP